MKIALKHNLALGNLIFLPQLNWTLFFHDTSYHLIFDMSNMLKQEIRGGKPTFV